VTKTNTQIGWVNLDDFGSEGAKLLLPGGDFELAEVDVNGVATPVFQNAPPNLRELYCQSLKHADDTFYVYETERYTFAETLREAGRVASGLQQLGIKAGDRIGIAMRNYPEWVFAYMGITSLGAIAVAMNAWWTGEEMAFAIEDSELNTIFVDRERLQNLSVYLDKYDLNVIAARTDPAAGRGVQSWANFIEATDQVSYSLAQGPDIAPDSTAMILYTSGSTSRPKGVMSSHRAIIHSILGWEAAAALARAQAGRQQRPRERQPSMIITVPLFHVTGLNGQLLPSLRNGRKVVGMYKWDVEKALAIIEREKISHFSGVPTMAYELVNSPNYDKYDVSSLRSIGGGGAAMTPKHSQRINERTNNRTRASAAYGMTETNGLAASNAGADLKRLPGSCGKALPPLVSIRIADKDNHTLEACCVGEICIKGAMNFSGYWRNSEATAKTIVDGWVHTGDIGFLNDEGYVHITDREKDMIIRGGENIGCQEVEAVLYEHPSVVECVVFGLPDERLGEIVAAKVVVGLDSLVTIGDIQSHVAEHLARFKVPYKVWIQEEKLPRTASGKIYKRGVRDEILAG
jgi:long-chain acyl-CoA synthetase